MCRNPSAGISRLAEALSHMVESPGGRSAADLVHQVADLLAVLCADPVYKVFYGAIVSTPELDGPTTSGVSANRTVFKVRV